MNNQNWKIGFLSLACIWTLLMPSSEAQTLLYSGTSPAVLQMEGTSGILEAIGTEGTGTLSLGGAGTRMVWYPGKASFRAGYVSGTQWDDTNIGLFSAAFGLNAKASGSFSFASGSNSNATSSGAVAFSGSTASGNYSLALNSATASGAGAFGMGFLAMATGTGAVAWGTLSSASGNGAFASGGAATASGSNSVAIGTNPVASGNNSSAFNYNSHATGVNSAAFNDSVVAGAFDSFVVGRYNVGGYSTTPTNGQTTWVPADPLFEVGNGTGTGANVSDALVVYKNGIVAVHTELRCPQAGDLTMGSFTSGTAP